MIRKLTTYLKEGNTYTAIEVCDIVKQKHYFFLEVARKKEELLITKKERCKDLEEVSTFYDKNCPAVLLINTKDVLSKIVEIQLHNNAEALVEKAFPNFNFEGFYYELTPFGNHTVVSIIKKEKVQDLFKEFVRYKISVVDFSLGISALETFKEYINQETIHTSNTTVVFGENTITKLASLKESDEQEIVPYQINGLEITRQFLLSFAGIFGFVSKRESSLSNLGALKDFYKGEFQNKRFFNVFSKAALGFILGVLVVNFLFFNHYFEKVGALETVTEVNSINKKKLNQLSARVAEKERRVDAILASGNSKSSYYLDILGQSIPNSILIDQIEYQPLLKPLRDAKPIAITKQVFMVSGSTINTTEFSSWIKQLEAKLWIAKVETVEFDYQSKESSVFAIKIALNE